MVFDPLSSSKLWGIHERALKCYLDFKI